MTQHRQYMDIQALELLENFPALALTHPINAWPSTFVSCLVYPYRIYCARLFCQSVCHSVRSSCLVLINMALYAELWDNRANILVQAQQLILYVIYSSNTHVSLGFVLPCEP